MILKIKSKVIMFKEKFQMVLQKDEEIKWSNRSNIMASVLKGLLPTIGIGIVISFFVNMMLGIAFFQEKMSKGLYLVPMLYILPTIIFFWFIYAVLNVKNTYFAITNKRIIKRTGAFNNNFIHYFLGNVGTVQVIGSLAASNGSATLLITTKDFHNDSKGNTYAARLQISSLCNA